MPAPIKNISEVVGSDFSAAIKTALPGFSGDEKGFVPNVTVVIGNDRAARRDAALALLLAFRGDVYRDRTVVISDYPEEIPARPPKKDSSLEEQTYAPALFSVTPLSSELPDEETMDHMTGTITMMTRLERTLKDFSRWDIDFYVVLSPIDAHAWATMVHLSLTGMLMFAGAARDANGTISIGESALQAFAMLGATSPEGNVAFIDLDQKKVFRTLAEAGVVA